jgi:radical SAM protein with 4Fe4S-binding SPASM domain
MTDMSSRDCRALFAGLKPIGVKTIDIIGGEPTMHPGIVRIISDASFHGFSVNISSNGDDLGTLEEIVKTGGDVSLGISINDRQTLDRCSAFIRKRKPAVKTVFSRGLDPGMIDEILALGPKQFYLIYRDAGCWEDLTAGLPFDRFLDAVRRLSGTRNIGTVFCSGFIPDTKQNPELGTARCPAGATKLGVMPDGSVYPCNLFFGKKEFILGNILSDPFDTIWHHPALDFFRVYSGNKCPQKDCELHARCHGGCPAQALVISGDLAAPDPRCLRETHFGTFSG